MDIVYAAGELQNERVRPYDPLLEWKPPGAKAKQYTLDLREEMIADLERLQAIRKAWDKKQPDVQKQIRLPEDGIQKRENEIEEILTEKARIHIIRT